MYYVYILLCSDSSLYTGYTVNIKNRLNDHRQGKGSKYVRGRLPIKLLYYEKYSDKSKALKREWQIKEWRRSKKIEILKLDVK